MKKGKASLLIVIIIISAVYIGIDYAIANVLPYSAIRPARIILKGITPASFNLKADNFNITVEDTLKLRGWFIYSDIQPARGTIFLLHGIAASKAMMLPTAKMLAHEGFNTVLYDSRANGESGGINCTFGFYEKYDLSSYIDSAIVRYPGSSPYAIFGHSLGGAVTIQALAHDKRLVCGIAQAPFAELKQTIRDYFSRMAFIRFNYIPDEALLHSEKIANFSADSVKPADAARKITQPVMIIHGLEDNYIYPEYGKKIYCNLASKQKEWYPVTGAKHNDVSHTAGDEWNRKFIEFYTKHLH